MTTTAAEAPDNYRQLAEAMQLLHSWRSGAQAKNGHGFNARDAGFGGVLASKPPEQWNHRMALIAWRFARKYRRQLAGAFIDVDGITQPVEGQPRRRRRSGKTEHYYVARLEGANLRLTSDGFPGWQALGAVKSITGRSSEKKKGPDGDEWVWRVPLTSAGEIMAAVKAGYVRIDGRIRAELAAVIDRRREAIQASQRVSADVEIKGLGGTLRPFQGAGVAYAARAKIAGTGVISTFFADEMGLGKTVQALAVVHMQGCRRIVAVVPASLKLNWAREARKWIPSLRRIQVLEGREPYAPHPDTDFVVINYDIVSTHAPPVGRRKKPRMPWVENLAEWAPDGVIVDEAHYCKNYKAQRTHAVIALAGLKSVRVRLALTGTPVENQPAELIPQLRILGRLDDLGGWKTFTQSYCVKGKWGGFGRGGQNLNQLNTKMRAGGFYVRRLKKDVLTELPAKVRVRLPIEIDRRRYDRIMKESALEIEAANKAIQQARLDRKRPPGWAMAAKVTSITKLRMAVAEAKLEAALSWCRAQMEQGEKLVVFGHHTDVVKRIGSELECPIIYGDTPADDRQAAVDRFQNDDACRAIGLNIKSGGVGLTLTASTNVVFIEFGWTPGANDQAEDRCHRIGQTGSVTAWYLEAANTIDQWLLDLIDEKRVVVDAATDGDATARREMAAELANEKNMVDRLAEMITENA